MNVNIDPKYYEVKDEVLRWITQSERNGTLLGSIAKKLLIFFPLEADFIQNFGLINNFVLLVF